MLAIFTVPGGEGEGHWRKKEISGGGGGETMFEEVCNY